MNFLHRFWRYLIGKTSEIKDLDYKDALLAATVAEIQAFKKEETPILVPLEEVVPIHRLDRENAQKKLKERVKELSKHKAAILEKKVLTKKELVKYLPSISHFKVVFDDPHYITFEGNGRLEALKEVFKESDKIQLEVDLIECTSSALKKVRKVRKVNNLI